MSGVRSAGTRLQRVPHGPGSYAARRGRLRLQRMRRPDIEREERIAIAQELIGRRLTGSDDGPEAVDVMAALEETVERVNPMPKPRPGMTPRQMEAAERKVLKNRLADVRTAFLGAAGGAVYVTGLGNELDSMTHAWGMSQLRRVDAELPGPSYPTADVLGVEEAWREDRPPSWARMHFYDVPAVSRSSFEQKEHESDRRFMREVVEDSLFVARNQVLNDRGRAPFRPERGRTLLSPELWSFANDIHEEFKEHKIWLLDQNIEEGTRPLRTLAESISGLPCENILTILQIINLWLRALLVDLPARLSGEDRRRFDRVIQAENAVRRLTLANAVTLFDVPASGRHAKLRDVLGKEPRGPMPAVKETVLRAELNPEHGSDRPIFARWTIPGMDAHLLDHPGRCTGQTPLEGDSKHYDMVMAVWRAFYDSNRFETRPRINLTNVAAFLSVLRMAPLIEREGSGWQELELLPGAWAPLKLDST